MKWFVFLLPILILLILFLYFALSGTCRLPAQTADPSYLSWMADIPDDTPLCQVVMPGSHDAGTVGMPWPVETQHCSIASQLSFGARYFDLRINRTPRGLVIYHSIFNGQAFSNVLIELKTFLAEHPSEVLILDFQHFKNDCSLNVFSLLSSELNDAGLAVRNTTDLSDSDFIRSLTIGQVRGKCLLFFGETEENFSNWIFLRNDDRCSRSDTVLDSYYYGEHHKAGFHSLVQLAHPEYFSRNAEKLSSETNGLFVLQCQLTDGSLIRGPWALERAQEEQMSAYVRSLASSEHLGALNIIMRDFLTPAKCADIIALNQAKGIN